MKLKPCTDDLISLFAIYPVIFLCELFLLAVFAWNHLLATALLLMDFLLLVCSIWEAVYFARTITLSQESCTFSLFSIQKSYPWTTLTVTVTMDDSPRFHDSDLCGRGILIYPKNSTPSKILSPMTCCRYFHPLRSVFLRFAANRQSTRSGKIVYRGFVVEETDLMAFLRSIEVI